MNIKELLIKVAEEVGADRELKILKGDEKTSSLMGSHPEIHCLMEMFNVTCRDLCRNHVPYLHRVKIKPVNLKYPISWLGSDVFCLREILKDGQPAEYKRVNEVLIFEEESEYECVYETAPIYFELEDEIDNELSAYTDAMIKNVAAFWFIANDMPEMFNEFHEMYLEEIKSVKGTLSKY